MPRTEAKLTSLLIYRKCPDWFRHKDLMEPQSPTGQVMRMTPAPMRLSVKTPWTWWKPAGISPIRFMTMDLRPRQPRRPRHHTNRRPRQSWIRIACGFITQYNRSILWNYQVLDHQVSNGDVAYPKNLKSPKSITLQLWRNKRPVAVIHDWWCFYVVICVKCEKLWKSKKRKNKHLFW